MQRQQPHYPVDNWSVLPFISTLNAIKCHYWLSNLPSALGSRCLLRQGSAYEVNAQWGAISGGNHITQWYFLPHFFFKHCVMVFWGWMLQKSSIGYHIWCPECVTVNRAVWKRWVYQILALLGFTHIKLFSVEHEQLWIPKKAILARWWQRQFPNIRDSRNDSQGRVTLVAQASEPRLSFTWCSLITCMRYGLHQMYPVTH